MTYETALAYVASLEPRGWRLGLDRMRAFVDDAGLRETVAGRSPRSIHVAGTNGKGSVTAFLQSMLVEHGLRTGAFFSPFVVDPRERVQFGRDMIPREDFAEIVESLRPIAERFTSTGFGGISEFEFKTAVGFEFWRRRGCEWVALEVGLGGRLDATNVVTSSCSAIVSIGLDHMNILGHSLAEIAQEKAGIIKLGVPVVVGELPSEAMEVVRRTADQAGSELWAVGEEIAYERSDGEVEIRTPRSSIRVVPSLAGSIQAHNAAVAYGALELAIGAANGAAAERGIASAFIPGRFQEITVDGVRVILDGAHNPDAAKVLVRSLGELAPGKHVLVTGMVAGHEPETFFRELESIMGSVHVAPIDYHRALPPVKVAEAAAAFAPSTAHGTLRSALEAALEEARPNGVVLITGSFYLVGEAVRAIGG